MAKYSLFGLHSAALTESRPESGAQVRGTLVSTALEQQSQAKGRQSLVGVTDLHLSASNFGGH